LTTYADSKLSIQKFVEMLRAELTSYPGRTALVARIVSACMTVMILAVVFRIPGAALGASFPLLISRENPKSARKSAFHIGVACSIGTAEAIVGGMLTAGSPFLHVMWVLASLFAVFYAISSLNFTNASLTVSALVAVAIQVWDYSVPAEVRVEHTLYTLLSILIACVVSALIETVFVKKHSPDAVLNGIRRRLSLVEALLGLTDSAEFPSSALTIQLSRSAARGVDDLWELLANSSYDASFRELLATVIALTSQLIELGANLAESAPILSIEDQESCQAIARNLVSIRSSLARSEIPELIDPPFVSRATNPILIEIERTSALIAQSFFDERVRFLPTAALTPSVRVSIAHGLRNAEHFKFAVRGTLSAFLCYVFYMSTGWLGLGASIITCTLTARRLTGASRHRQSLRFAGFIVGAGVIGLGTQVLILPGVDSIAGFTLLFAAVIWIGSWVGTSGPRIAYSGFQIVLAYSLVNLNKFTINTSLVPARDAILGILLGVIAMWLVFDHLWAETSSTSVRNLLLGTLRKIADFKAISAESSREANQRLAAEGSRINRNFDELRNLADMYAFEAFPKRPHESLVNRSIRTLLPELRAFLLVKAGLLQHRNLAITPVGEVLIQEVEENASSVLRGLANAIEAEAPEKLSPRDAHAEELRAKVLAEEEKSGDGKDLQKHTEMRLCLSLLDIASDLERRVRLNFALEADVPRAIVEWSVEAVAKAEVSPSRVE
jgi:multidrug resistance protein MdtO